MPGVSLPPAHPSILELSPGNAQSVPVKSVGRHYLTKTGMSGLCNLFPFRVPRRQPRTDLSTPDLSTPELSTPELSTPELSTPEPSTPEPSTPEPSTPWEWICYGSAHRNLTTIKVRLTGVLLPGSGVGLVVGAQIPDCVGRTSGPASVGPPCATLRSLCGRGDPTGRARPAAPGLPARGSAGSRRVLGRLAQRESASFTPRRSLVRSQYRPPTEFR